jgi:putative PIN family toxin of toxin-antitoxin system
MPERVVLDTNVWISGLLWHGDPYGCLFLARSRMVQAIYCSSMVVELTGKLRSKFKFSENRIAAVVYDLRQMAEEVSIAGQVRAVGDDPEDDKFVECALVGKASWLVSGDHHLLDLKEYQSVRIIPPRALLERFGW